MPINTSACKDAHIWKTIFGPRCKDLTVRMSSELNVSKPIAITGLKKCFDSQQNDVIWREMGRHLFPSPE